MVRIAEALIATTRFAQYYIELCQLLGTNFTLSNGLGPFPVHDDNILMVLRRCHPAVLHNDHILAIQASGFCSNVLHLRG